MADEKQAAVYVSWLTFKNALEGLVQGIPNQIDRSTFPGLSGGVQSQLFAAMKFMGLTNEDGKPTATLETLAVADEAERKEKLKQILRERYADLFALDLLKTTPNQLTETMGSSYGVSGDTRGKAVRFFLSAASYVGVPMSRLFKVPGASTVSNGAPRKKRKLSPKVVGVTHNLEDEEEEQKPSGTSRAVTLRSGGTLTLAASLDLFQLTPADRNFVFELIDKLEAYEKEQESGK